MVISKKNLDFDPVTVAVLTWLHSTKLFLKVPPKQFRSFVFLQMDTFLQVSCDLYLRHAGLLNQFFFQSSVVFHEISDFSPNDLFFAPEKCDTVLRIKRSKKKGFGDQRLVSIIP